MASTRTPPTAAPHDLATHAIREVVARCLYGADINAMAVEMCKLSLWLVSLDRDLPFSFVDDKILHGNSLLGLTDLRQLTHPAHRGARPTSRPGLFELGTWTASSGGPSTPPRRSPPRSTNTTRMRSATAKRRQWRRVPARSPPTYASVADGVIAAGLRARRQARQGAGRSVREPGRSRSSRACRQRDGRRPVPCSTDPDSGLTPTVDDGLRALEAAALGPRRPRRDGRHGGFDAVIGNPPFLGGQKLTGAMGTNVRDWFVHQSQTAPRAAPTWSPTSSSGRVDLLWPSGTLGLIATNTIAQGDTRQVGLDRWSLAGFTITRAHPERSLAVGQRQP